MTVKSSRYRGGRSKGGNGKGNSLKAASAKKKTLSDYNYYLGRSRQASDYKKTTEFLINHIKKTYDHGKDIATALKNLSEFDLTPYAPKLLTSTKADAAKATEEKQFEIDYNKKSERFIIRKEQYQKNKDKAYAFLWERCATSMQNKIQMLSTFESDIEDDPIKLLEQIKIHAMSFQEDKYPMEIIVDSLFSMLHTKQKEKEHLSDYTKRFKVYCMLHAMYAGRRVTGGRLISSIIVMSRSNMSNNSNLQPTRRIMKANFCFWFLAVHFLPLKNAQSFSSTGAGTINNNSRRFLHSNNKNNNKPTTAASSSKWVPNILARSFFNKDNNQKTSLAATPATAEDTTTTTPPKEGDGKTVLLADSDAFVKPELDDRKYRCIVLPNNLKALLVSTADVAGASEGSQSEGAAIHVQAGQMDDTIPGLAHFHEHMLFLGTEKYPDENEHEQFLNKYGGSSNAYTDMEDTNYYFSVTTQTEQNNSDGTTSTEEERASEGLHGGLERFSQFFIAPKFEESMVEREMNAVDSEYLNSKTSDSWRNFQLLKSCANHEHPFSNFGCGSYDTLTKGNTTSPRPALVDFWNTYYKTHNLRLSVIGHSSLDALQKSVEETFGKLQHSEGPHRRILKKTDRNQDEAIIFKQENSQYKGGVPAFGPEQVGKFVDVIPIAEARDIKISFATPPSCDPLIQKSRPERVLSHLQGHESPGSLHFVLNELGYITGLSSGTSIDTSDFSLFSLSLSLTPKGMAEKDKVLDLSFQWIALIKDAIVNQPELMAQYHQELQQMSANNFRFRENANPVDFCSLAAEELFHSYHPIERILVGGYDENETYDDKLSLEYLKRMTPENCIITTVDSDLKQEQEEGEGAWKTEPWYGANHRIKQIPVERMKSWDYAPDEVDKRLHLPELNKYIPSDFSLRCDDNKEEKKEGATAAAAEEEAPPILLVDTPKLRLWHKMDSKWRVPKAFISVSLISPETYRSPRSMTLNRIFQKVLNDDLNSYVYAGSIAGAGYSISCTPTGCSIQVSGYSEKLPVLLDTLTARMLSLIEEMKHGSEESTPGLYMKFMKAKEGLLRETKNYRLESPYSVASYNARLVLEESIWFLDDYINEMEGDRGTSNPLTLEECARAAEESLTGRITAQSLCMGNINEEGAKRVAEVIDDCFLKAATPLSEVENLRFKSMKLPTKVETEQIFGASGTSTADVADTADATSSPAPPLIYQELAYSESEETNAVEYILQAGSELELGYEGLALLDVIAHIGYNSAFSQLRTKEQLGYIVSANARSNTGGSVGLSVVVQSSSAVPTTLEQRIEAWLQQFRTELENMDADEIATEASAIVSQLLQRNTRLGSEVSRYWSDIVKTEPFFVGTTISPMQTPVFDNLQKLATHLTIAPGAPAQAFKTKLLAFFDAKFDSKSEQRKVMSSRVYNRAAQAEYEQELENTDGNVLSTFAEIRQLKQYLSAYPVVPYWRNQQSKKSAENEEK